MISDEEYGRAVQISLLKELIEELSVEIKNLQTVATFSGSTLTKDGLTLVLHYQSLQERLEKLERRSDDPQ